MHQLNEQIFPDHWPGDVSHQHSTLREGKGKGMLTEHLLRSRSMLVVYFTVTLTHTRLFYTFLSLVFLRGLETLGLGNP